MLHVDAGSLKARGPLALGPGLEALRALPGVRLSTAPLPYNAATDAALSGRSAAEVAQDAAWERRRGSDVYEAARVRDKQALGLLPRGVVATERAAGGGGSPSASSSSRGDGARLLLGEARAQQQARARPR